MVGGEKTEVEGLFGQTTLCLVTHLCKIHQSFLLLHHPKPDCIPDSKLFTFHKQKRSRNQSNCSNYQAYCPTGLI